MVFGEGKNAEQGDVGAGAVGGDFYRKPSRRACGRGRYFLFDNAVLYCFAWREYDCPRVLSDYGLTQHGVS